ncbi:hypothetical protein [Microbispora bryophytorum]|uniref:hypothetical protein n=1 Tax=Microbispora bryophytorum TaxID=1460882 RepID=UPI003713FA17
MGLAVAQPYEHALLGQAAEELLFVARVTSGDRDLLPEFVPGRAAPAGAHGPGQVGCQRPSPVPDEGAGGGAVVVERHRVPDGLAVVAPSQPDAHPHLRQPAEEVLGR